MKQMTLKRLSGALAAAAVAVVLVGCNGKTGQNGLNGTNGTNGTDGAPGTPGATYALDITTLSADEWSQLTMKGSISSVTITGGIPQVKFKLTDGHNVPLKGLATFTSKASTAAFTSYPNIGFSIAKLVPGSAGSPSQWVNYIITSNPTAAAPTTWNLTTPTTDNIGVLTEPNSDGNYVYTFRRDITTAKTVQGAFTDTATKLKADLGDLTYDPSLTHRVTLYVGGIARGTGSAAAGDRSFNTPDGSDSGVKGVPVLYPLNSYLDFVPNGGAITESRRITNVDSCFSCHSKFEFHGGGRQDTNYCVVCHTEQRKFGQTDADPTGTLTTYTGSTSKIAGMAQGNFTTMVHKVHMGEELTKKGYNYANVLFNEVTYPQDQRNCVKCHSAGVTGAEGDIWFKKPSRLACGACHDGVNFATGTGHGHGGVQLTDQNCAECHTEASIKLSHIPVVAPDPNNGYLVAGGNNNTNASFVAAYSSNLPAGAQVITWGLNSVTLNASQQPVFKFRFKSNGQPVTFNAQPAAADATVELMPDFVGGPSVYLSFAVPQDGITAPADPNATVSGYIRNIWNKTATGTGAGTMTFDAATGLYTLTLTGVKIPTNATLISGGIGYSYGLSSTQPLTQINGVTGFPWAPNFYAYNVEGKKQGGLSVPAPNEWKALSGTVPTGFNQSLATATRRKIVDNAKCNACHGKMGVFTTKAFHAGQRNDADTCVWCHNTDRVNSGWGVNIKDAVHSIHGASKRVNKYSWEYTAGDTYFNTTYPSVLNNCEICHVAGSYDFDNAKNAGAVPSLLWTTVATAQSTTVATGTLTVTGTTPYSASSIVIKTGQEVVPTGAQAISPFVTAGTNYGAGFGTLFSATNAGATTREAAGTTLVNSPYVGACTGCHDSNMAIDHMRTNGGSFYRPRAEVIDPATGTFDVKKIEQCFLCHSAGKVADVQKVHMNFK